MENVVIVPDGYNGDFVILSTEPLKEEGNLVLLRCVEKGKEHLTRWIYKSELE